MINFRKLYELFFRRHGVYGFLNKFSHQGSTVLDVGCGNDSAFQYKKAFPLIYYIGLDIQDYQNSNKGYEDRLITCKPEDFSTQIRMLKDIDIVISRHNLEHCNEPIKVVEAICDCLKPGGIIFFAFPNKNSVNLPSRRITLNYFDDLTHNPLPPDLPKIVKILEQKNLSVLKVLDPYQPTALRLLGALQTVFGFDWKSITGNLVISWI